MQQNQILIEGIQKGDKAVLKAFYKKNLPYVHKYILRNKGRSEDVDDVFQDSLVLIYHKLRNGSLQINSSIHSYFMEVCKNKWRNQLRKQQKVYYNDLLVRQEQDRSELIVNNLTQEDKEQLYYKHVSCLKDDHKNILQLFFEGKSMREIAMITGYTEGYTRKKKFQIKERLLKMIKNDPVYQELVV